MKVGIITFHSAHNYGAVLQSYALQETVKALGYYVKIIDFRMPEIQEKYKLFSLQKYRQQIANPYILLKLFISDIINIPSRYKKNKTFSNFIKNFMNLTDKTFIVYEDLDDSCQEFDAFICGSDQIWNPGITGGLSPVYFLGFVKSKTCRKISYAASIGTNSIHPSLNDKFKEYINAFDYISVREKTLLSILENITDKPIVNVLDPTLLVTEAEWNKIAKKSFIREQYILVYQLEYNPEMVKIVDYLSEKLKLSIVHFNKKIRFKNEIHIFPYASPEEFLGLFHDASFVITNSFHGTAFSVIYNKPFFSIPHTTSGSRMIDLLSTLELDDRIVYSIKDLDKEIQPIDYILVNDKLENEKQESLNYLKRALA